MDGSTRSTSCVEIYREFQNGVMVTIGAQKTIGWVKIGAKNHLDVHLRADHNYILLVIKASSSTPRTVVMSTGL